MLVDVLARLEEMEKRILSLSEIIEATTISAQKGSEISRAQHIEKNGEDRRTEKEEDMDAKKDHMGNSSKLCNVPAKITTNRSGEVSNDPRYKYTEIVASASSKTEKPRERPKHTTSPPENSDTVVEYEIRFIKDTENEEKREFIISSSRLKRLMWTVVSGWVEHCGSDKDWNNDKPLPLRPLVIFHHWDQLQTLAKVSENVSEGENDTRSSLQHLLDDIELVDSDKYMEFKGFRDLKMTLYVSMHYLFSPGTFMVAYPFMGLPQVFQVDSYQYDKETFNLSVWAYDWDGVALLRRPYRFLIDKFDGEKRINELPIYPVEFFVDDTDANVAPKTGWPALRKAMAARAEMYRKFCACKKGSQLFRYSGPALVLKSAQDVPLTTRDTYFREALFGSPDRRIMAQQNVSPTAANIFSVLIRSD